VQPRSEALTRTAGSTDCPMAAWDTRVQDKVCAAPESKDTMASAEVPTKSGWATTVWLNVNNKRTGWLKSLSAWPCTEAETKLGDPHGGPQDNVKLEQALTMLPHTAMAEAHVVHGMCVVMPEDEHCDPTGHATLALNPAVGQYDPLGHVMGSVVIPMVGQKDPGQHNTGATKRLALQNDPTGQTRGSASKIASAAGQ
jgi:hypothetical protein